MSELKYTLLDKGENEEYITKNAKMLGDYTLGQLIDGIKEAIDSGIPWERLVLTKELEESDFR